MSLASTRLPEKSAPSENASISQRPLSRKSVVVGKEHDFEDPGRPTPVESMCLTRSVYDEPISAAKSGAAFIVEDG